VDIAGSAMPMQKIETVDMPRSEALAGGQTTLGELKTTMQDDFRNRLVWGDNKLVMASHLKGTTIKRVHVELIVAAFKIKKIEME